MGDLERVVAKVCLGRALPRDLTNLRLSLTQIPALKSALTDCTTEALIGIRDDLKLCRQVARNIQEALADDPAATLTQGGVIRSQAVLSRWASVDMERAKGINRDANPRNKIGG